MRTVWVVLVIANGVFWIAAMAATVLWWAPRYDRETRRRVQEIRRGSR